MIHSFHNQVFTQEKLCPHKNLYVNVHGTFICNSPKLGTIQMSTNRWMHKQIVIELHNGILLSNDNEWTTDAHSNMHKSQSNYSDWKKPDKKECVLTVWPSLYNFLLHKVQTIVTESRSVVKWKEGLPKGMRKVWGAMGMLPWLWWWFHRCIYV